MSLLHYMSYAGAAAAFVFITLSLASGLLWISELIEEHSRNAKVVGERGIYAIILIHIALYFYDSLPLRHVLFSIVCHIVYLQNFTASWPIISLSSLGFIASCIMVVIDHFIWFFHFAHLTQEARHRSRMAFNGRPRTQVDAPGFAEIATFFGICVWLAPLFLFLSLSANDNTLPVKSSGRESVPNSPVVLSSPIMTRPKGSLFKSLFDTFPRIRSKARREVSQGIIAPPSPNFRPMSSPNLRPVSPIPTPDGLRRVPSMQSLSNPASPRSSMDTPGSTRSAHFLSPDARDVFMASASESIDAFSLGPPPPRRGSTSRSEALRTPLRRTTTDGRLERRTVSSNSGVYDGGF